MKAFWKDYPIYIFFRKEGFYPVQLKDDEDARANAELNAGTLKVETSSGKIVWRAKKTE